MDENTLDVTVANTITIGLMVLIFFAALGAISVLWRKMVAKNDPATAVA